MKRITNFLVLFSFFTILVGAAQCKRALGQSDLLVTASFADSIERFDGNTGDYLGSFIAAGSGGLDQPGAVVAGPDGNVYVSSSLTNEILRYDGVSGAFIDVFASGNGINTPNNVVFHGDVMYVGNFADGVGGFVKRFNATTGAFIDDFVDVDFADGIEFTSDSILVSSFGGDRVGRFDLNDGSFIEDFVSRQEGGLRGAAALLFLDNGELLVSSFSTNSIKRYSADGVYIDDPITNLTQPEGLAIGPNGNLYAGSYGLGRINEYDIDTFNFVGEFARVGPVTNFFSFRNTSVPEPGVCLPLAALASFFSARRRRRSN